MSKPLQIELSDESLAEIERLARDQNATAVEWAQQVILSALNRGKSGRVETKLEAVREAVKHSFPTGDVQEMLREIEQGYR